MAGFSFQDQAPKHVVIDVPRMLDQVQHEIDVFAKHEDLAVHIVAIEATGNYESLKAVDRKAMTSMSSELSQTKDWYYALQKIVPYLILELIKSAPKNASALEKAQKFWNKPFRWSAKTGNPWLEVSEKYLSVLDSLRKQLAVIQEAAAHAETRGAEPESVGKFLLYDSLGDPSAQKTAITVLKSATRAMTSIGMGAHCYGKVTLVNSAKFVKHSAAFYVKNTDEMFLSPDLEGEDVRAVCHEIGHRIHTKLSLTRRSADLYAVIKERGAWVTNYARTDAEENFCEMVSFAALKKLPDDTKDLLRAALPKLKLATASSVAARFRAWAH